ncbi:MAG TPA: hypothetical protein PLM53_03795 [Spirochaetota bacterium]|mgnify:CR=1 FL=1|nr:hypothetical protein [Spirochaetota bacterium]HPC40227.1 hypothetical protein [Spirochaetota bacterium]HPL16733.1 hypothetical protein [Spirochaetota bacterium]HQF07299.1 hypothetical protein [Spirochaetota bacterium]HQH96200.1 hypothetical protein [Spirochaetota bacterium]
MKLSAILFLICASSVLFGACSREDYRSSLVGTWELTGDSCDTGGNCRKEIITDEESGETFTAEGLYISKRSKIGYSVAGSEIRLASDSDAFNTVYGEILSIKNGVMLLRKDSVIRRYGRIGGAKR